MIIDAKGLIMGRLASFAASKALAGERVDIVNCDKIIIAGAPKNQVAMAKRRQVLHTVSHGPYIPKRPYGLMKRAIRGMLPYRKERGKDALARVKCYDDYPEELKEQPVKTPETIHSNKLTNLKRITLGEVCNRVSGPKGGNK
jgi:large subunit ribosomal protein L13